MPWGTILSCSFIQVFTLRTIEYLELEETYLLLLKKKKKKSRDIQMLPL